MLRRLIWIPVCAILLTIFVGCAQIQVNNRLQEYKVMLDPMIGVATMDDIATRFGVPVRTVKLGSSEVWEYHKSFGVRGTANAYTPTSYNQYGVSTFAQGRSHEVYDKVTVTFDNSGILKNWNAYVQR